MKAKRIDIRVSEWELQQLNEEAQRRGLTNSELIRSLIARFPEPLKYRNIKPS